MAAEGENNFKLSEVQGNLFAAPASYSLAHCVGADFDLAAGVAAKFKQIFGRVNDLRAQNVSSGGVAVLTDGKRYVYYLVTKSKSFGASTYENLHSALTKMRDHMKKHRVKKLAIPRLGCGHDGLEWNKVRDQLELVFGADKMEVVVYNFSHK